jgi:FtsP/CotA-like multicopper oxidase with cupredoxin domain
MDHGLYRFKAPHPGTYLYHCHVVSAIHVQAGMYGMLIIKPKGSDHITWEGGYSFSRDYNFLLSEVDTNWHTDEHLLHPLGHVKIKVPPYNPTYFLVNGLSGSQLKSENKKMFERNENTFLRLANIGYYANKYVFSDKLNATVISSDGRPLPETLILDTLTIFPGERYGVLVNSSTLDDDSIQIEYLNLNTLSAEGTEYIRYQVVEELSANTLSPAWLQVFPNPFTSSLKLRNLGNEDIRNIAIYTLSGQLVYTDAAKYNSSVVLQLGHLAAGSYLIQVTTESGNKIRRKLHKF